jgi:hypothetical protein
VRSVTARDARRCLGSQRRYTPYSWSDPRKRADPPLTNIKCGRDRGSNRAPKTTPLDVLRLCISDTLGGLCDRGLVEIAAELVERIPVGNLRVRRADFVAVWVEAERIVDQNTRTGATDWYIAGVAVTCRWLATAIIPGLRGRTQPAWAPITHRTAAAHEELIETETLAAERWIARHPDGMQDRPGWLEAVLTTCAGVGHQEHVYDDRGSLVNRFAEFGRTACRASSF